MDDERSRLTPAESRGTAVLGGAAVALIIGVGVVFMLASRPSSDDTARFARPVMPGHESVMPTDVHPHAGRGQLQVLVGDYWFDSSAKRLRAERYTFSARNYGVVHHDVMIERMPIKMEGPGRPIDEAAPFGIDGLEPRMTKTTTVALAPARWEIFGSVSGHYQAGQHRVLTVYGRLPRGMSSGGDVVGRDGRRHGDELTHGGRITRRVVGLRRMADVAFLNSLEPLAPAHHRAAAIVLADAFLDDPGWVAVGPRNARARWKLIYRTWLGAIRVGARWCGPSWCIVEEDEPIALLTGCAPGRAPRDPAALSAT